MSPRSRWSRGFVHGLVEPLTFQDPEAYLVQELLIHFQDLSEGTPVHIPTALNHSDAPALKLRTLLDCGRKSRCPRPLGYVVRISEEATHSGSDLLLVNHDDPCYSSENNLERLFVRHTDRHALDWDRLLL
jgi:hypothetical protein